MLCRDVELVYKYGTKPHAEEIWRQKTRLPSKKVTGGGRGLVMGCGARCEILVLQRGRDWSRRC